MEKNSSSENIDDKNLKDSTAEKRREVHKKIEKISCHPETTEYSSKSTCRHNVNLKNILVNHYSTVDRNQPYIKSKSDTAIELSISQPLKETKHSNQLKYIDLEDYLTDKDSRKKHVKRSGHIYHPEVVTKYVYNRKDKLLYDVPSNRKKTQDFLKLLNQPNIMNELQYLDKKDSVDHMDTDDRNTKSKPEYLDTEKQNDKMEYLDPRARLNKVDDREKLKDNSKAVPVTTPNPIMFSTEGFAEHSLLNELDYKKNKQILNNNLDYFTKNDNLEVEKLSTVSTLKLAYFPKQILKSKNVGKRDDYTEKKLVTKESPVLYTTNNEKYNIEHDYFFKEDSSKIAKTPGANVDVREDSPENKNKPKYETPQKDNLNQNDEHDYSDYYTVNAPDMKTKFAAGITLWKDTSLTLGVINNTNDYNERTALTTPGLRIQENFGKTTTGVKNSPMKLTEAIFIERTTPRLTNRTGM